MNNPELLPCPFCGGEVEIYHDTSSDYERQWTYTVRCPNQDCGCDFGHYDTIPQVAQKWNKRKTLPTHDLHIAFHEWLFEYEVNVLERWHKLAVDEWTTLINAQWEAFKTELANLPKVAR